VQPKDVEWEFIEPYLPIGGYGPYPERLRQQFEGVIWRFKTGGQWREMPQEFGAWPTVHNRFRQWRDAGVFEALLEGLIAEAAKRVAVDLSLVSIDSTTARAHHDAAGMHLGEDVLTALEKAAAEEAKARSKGQRRRTNGQDAEADPAREERRRIRRRRKLRLKAALLGRSRGGQTSKVHLSVDRKCRPLAFVLTAGQAADSPQFIPVLVKIRVRGPRRPPPHSAGRGRWGQGLLVPR
jgi:transposase